MKHSASYSLKHSIRCCKIVHIKYSINKVLAESFPDAHHEEFSTAFPEGFLEIFPEAFNKALP